MRQTPQQKTLEGTSMRNTTLMESSLALLLNTTKCRYKHYIVRMMISAYIHTDCPPVLSLAWAWAGLGRGVSVAIGQPSLGRMHVLLDSPSVEAIRRSRRRLNPSSCLSHIPYWGREVVPSLAQRPRGARTVKKACGATLVVWSTTVTCRLDKLIRLHAAVSTRPSW